MDGNCVQPPRTPQRSEAPFRRRPSATTSARDGFQTRNSSSSYGGGKSADRRQQPQERLPSDVVRSTRVPREQRQRHRPGGR